MESKPTKTMSRRDAMKILGAAAGASVLAGLPTKWSKPELAAGVLPAHAQTTGVTHTVDCGPISVTINPGPEPGSAKIPGIPVTSTATITPQDPGVSMHYHITLTNLSTADPLDGDVLTDALGKVEVSFHVLPTGGQPLKITVKWSFTDSAVSPSSCTASAELLD